MLYSRFSYCHNRNRLTLPSEGPARIMAPRIPDDFAEFRAGKKRIYLRRGLESLRDYLAAYSYPWPSLPGSDSSGPAGAPPSYEGRTALSRIALDDRSGEAALVKHYCRGGLFRRLLRDRYFGRRRFLRELEAGEAARARGVPAVEILALVVEKNGVFTHRADLVTREIRDAVDLREYIERTFPTGDGDQARRTESSEALLSAVASLLRKMHDAGMYHADLNVKNILVREDDGTPRCYIIDLDRARCRRSVSTTERLKNLGRLYRSLEKTGLAPHRISEPDMRRFVELYCRRDPELEAGAQRLLKKTSLGLRLHRLLWRFDRRQP